MSETSTSDRQEALAAFTLATVAGHFRRLQGQAERDRDAENILRHSAYATVADYLLWQRLFPRGELRDFLLARLVPWERVASRLQEACNRSPLWDDLLRALADAAADDGERRPT